MNFSEEPPALPKKIRSCCLYKYPDWVQGMVGGEGGGGGHGHSHGGGGLGSSQGAYHPSQAGSGPSTTTTSGRPLLRSMREAQLHSAVPPISAPSQSQTSASQLDPGSRYGQQSRRSSKAPGTGANSLLKQAIANRMMPHVAPLDGGETSTNPNFASSSATSPTTEPARIHRTDSSEMSKSVLLNPAWYRDDQGRTGYKTSDWEKMSNQQKNVVKENRKKRKESTSETGVIKELDPDLLSQSSSEKADSGSDNKSMSSVQSDQKDLKDAKDSKLDKKQAKALEKEKKKLEKEQKKLEKAQKKKEAEEEKKLKKKKGSSTNISEVGEHESVEMKTVEKKKEKAEATITLTMVSKDKKTKSQEKSKQEKHHETTESDSSKETIRKDSTEKISKEKVKKQSSKEDTTDKDSRNEGRPPSGTTHSSVRKLKAESFSKKTGHGEPRKKNIGDRRDSSMSELSRGSFKSVTFNDRVQTHEIERNSSVYTSSEDDAAIMSDDEMSKPSQAKMKKKLTMLQQQDPQMYNQMGQNRQQEEHTDIYDDEDLEDFEEQERLALLAAQGYDFRREMQYDQNEGVPYEDDESEEEENEEEDAEDTLSQNSYYAEDVEGADIYLRNEHSFLGTDVNPRVQIQNVGGYEMFDRTMLGSMSKLHGEDSASNSLLFGYNLPRSASGYFEPPPEAGPMNFSYEEAMLNRQVQALQQQQLLQQLQKLPLQSPQLQRELQHEVPGVHKLSPSGGSLRQTATQRSIYENVTPGDLLSQPQSLIIPQSPSQRNLQARHEFFTQTPSNVVSKTIMAASSDGQSVQSLGSTDSNATVRAEDEMRKKFVARFGVRKAPIAREEDPADPQHMNVMGSQESMNSTDSRESVVSAASIKAEALARRNFNY
ncbi:hypothetical protein GCK72_024444 [Caenorhabditis remanei]|uniref:Uncharacterized protein n=1 Tax=Caenorhabditis remanei TaxID=31234 RepID=A0A6A5FZC5_CAERE|nr:hypothetical protein GCK72_024444 [Caenorhabditis remanei]KAF1747977.1 hypothetical protein GCK72_024444 [Caenorhabditis remanei]